jgi:hypothetical protein
MKSQIFFLPIEDGEELKQIMRNLFYKIFLKTITNVYNAVIWNPHLVQVLDEIRIIP